jgi:hypothetical protein
LGRDGKTDEPKGDGENMSGELVERGREAREVQSMVWAESNLALNVFFRPTVGERATAPYGYETEVKGKDGSIKKSWMVIPTGEYGAPNTQDQDVYIAVIKIVDRRGGMPENGEITTTPGELLSILGWADAGDNYAALERSMERIMHTGIQARETFYSKATDTYLSEGFRIWDVRVKVVRKKADGRQVKQIVIKFHELFRESFLAHYLKGLDTDFYYSLRLPVAKRLYKFIDQARGEQEVWSEGIFELQRRIPIGPYKYPSKIKQVLKRPCEELVSKGFLAEFWYDAEHRTYFRISETFARRRAAFELSESPDEFIGVERLTAEGVWAKRAQELVAEYGAARCMKWADLLAFQRNVRSETKPKLLEWAIKEEPGWWEEVAFHNCRSAGPSRDAGADPSPLHAGDAPRRRATVLLEPEVEGEDGSDGAAVPDAGGAAADAHEAADSAGEASSRQEEASRVWREIFEEVSDRIEAVRYRAGVEDFVALDLVGDSLHVECRSPATGNHLLGTADKELYRIWVERRGPDASIVLSVADHPDNRVVLGAGVFEQPAGEST